MREYAFIFILLLTLCSVSPLKIYLPEEPSNDAKDYEDRFIIDQMTATCLGVCLDRRLSDVAACQTWCRAPLAAAAVAASLDDGDMGHGIRPSPRPPPPAQMLLHPRLGGDRALGNGARRPEARQATVVKEIAEKRQVDPLLSCIEARCAGLGRIPYGNCIFSKCLAGWKRKKDGRRQRDGAATASVRQEKSPRRREENANWSLTLGDADDVKRSWNDVMQTCIEYKCRNTAPGTFDYNVCIQQACSKHMFGKR